MSFPQGGGQGGRNNRQIITGEDALLKMSIRVLSAIFLPRFQHGGTQCIKSNKRFVHSFIRSFNLLILLWAACAYPHSLAHFALMKKSAKVLHYFGLDCSMFEFFKYSTHEPSYKRKLNTFLHFLESDSLTKMPVCAHTVKKPSRFWGCHRIFSDLWAEYTLAYPRTFYLVYMQCFLTCIDRKSVPAQWAELFQILKDVTTPILHSPEKSSEISRL